MRLTCCCFALAVGAVFAPAVVAARGASLGPVMVAAPPLAADAGASAIFDAMLAISRAKATYPSGAAQAATPYGAALERYNAGDAVAARNDALQAIALSSRRPYPQPAAWTSPSPSVAATSPMPELVDVAQARGESMLAVGRRALIDCGVTDQPLLQALRGRYSSAVSENLRHEYDQVIADAQTIIDACVPH
jgi:hypothetical protein